MDDPNETGPLRPSINEKGLAPAKSMPGDLTIFLRVFGRLGLALLLFAVVLFFQAQTFFLEVPMRVDKGVYAELFYDIGKSINAEDSVKVWVAPSSKARKVRFALPNGKIYGFRFDPAEGPATVWVGPSVIRCGADALIGAKRTRAQLGVESFQPVQQIDRAERDGDGMLRLTTAPDATDPICALAVPNPIKLAFDKRAFWLRLTPALIAYFVLSAALFIFWRQALRHEASRRWIMARQDALGRAWGRSSASARDWLLRRMGRAESWCRRHPRKAIWLAALAGAVISCYPVVFFGKSFVSPNIYGMTLLYEGIPTLPEYSDSWMEDSKFSDVGAMMWSHMPLTFVERRAVLGGELPLWNRYNSNGLPLLGQGQLMFGDPLHTLLLLAGGNSWAWDAKYVLAKVLFAAGLGLIIYRATRHLPSALLLGFASAFIGFFAYRFNHPAYFSLCYAPWMLYPWLEMLRAERPRAAAPWIGLLLLANWAEMNSGTVKEAYMLLLGINFCGFLVFALSDAHSLRWKLGLLGLLMGAGVGFALISSPVWVTLFDTLKQSYSGYDEPHAMQIQPGLLAGLFDDIFYRQFCRTENVFNPSTNFVVLLGVALAAGYFKTLMRDRVFLALTLGAFGAFAMVFGVVSPTVIRAIPFVANVNHIDNTFSCVLIIPLIVLAGFGLKRCWRRFSSPDWPMDAAAAGAALLVLLCLFFGFTHAAQRSDITFLHADEEIRMSHFFWAYLAALLIGFLALPFALRRLVLNWGKAGAISVLPWLAIFLGLLLWRNGNHVFIAFNDYVANPPARVNLQPHSPTVDFVHQQTRAEPGRAVGFGVNLLPGFNAALSLETISGPDALMSPLYRRLIKACKAQLEWDWRLAVTKDMPPSTRRLFDLLNVRFYLDRRGAGVPAELGLQAAGQFDMDVYRSDSAWPRAFFTDAVSVYKGAARFAELVLSESDGKPLAAVDRRDLPENPALRALPQDQARRRVAPANDYRLRNNSTSFRVEASGPGVIALTETYVDEDIRVTLNGQPARSFRVNEAFRGVAVEKAGVYEVTFNYWPHHFTRSLWMAAFGLAWLGAGAAALFYGGRRKPRATERPVETPQTAAIRG
jgi:hypothetical protein